jgi:HEAT repeat protein
MTEPISDIEVSIFQKENRIRLQWRMAVENRRLLWRHKLWEVRLYLSRLLPLKPHYPTLPDDSLASRYLISILTMTGEQPLSQDKPLGVFGDHVNKNLLVYYPIYFDFSDTTLLNLPDSGVVTYFVEWAFADADWGANYFESWAVLGVDQRSSFTPMYERDDVGAAYYVPPGDAFAAYQGKLLRTLRIGFQQELLGDWASLGKPLPDQTEFPLDVERLFERYGIDVPLHDEADNQPITLAQAMQKYEGRVLVIGDSDSGKSTLLKRAAYMVARRHVADNTAPLPVMFYLRYWGSNQFALQESITHWVAHMLGASTHAIDERLKQGTMMLFLEDLNQIGIKKDEISDPRQRFLELLPPHVRLVMTCRSDEYEELIRQGQHFTGIGVVRVMPLSDAYIRGYLNNSAALWDILQHDPVLLDMVRVPVLLRLVAFAYHAAPDMLGQFRDLTPDQQYDAVIRQYVIARYAYENRQRSQALPFSLDEVYDYLSYLALVWIDSGFISKDDTHHFDLFIPEQRLFVNFLEPKNETPQKIRSFIDFAVELKLLSPYNPEHPTLWEFVHPHFLHHFLFAALQHRQSQVRNGAVVILGNRIGAGRLKPRLIAALIDMLADNDAQVRATTAEALGNLGDIRALNPLLDMLRDEAALVRASVAEALGKLGDARAVNRLLDVLLDDDLQARKAIIIALGQLGDEQVIDSLIPHLMRANTRHVSMDALVQVCGTGITALLITLMETAPLEFADFIVEWIAHNSDKNSVDTIMKAIHHPNINVRRSLVVLLGELNTAQAVDVLVAMLAQNEPDAIVRRRIVSALGKIVHADAAAIEQLTAALGDTDVRVSRLASIALEHIGTPVALQAVQTWRDDQNKPQV